MYQYGRVASSRRKFGFGHWLGVASVIAVCAPLGCAVYEPSMQPSDDVAGLQADAGASGDRADGGAGSGGSGGRAGSSAGSSGAPVIAAGGAGGGSPPAGASGSSAAGASAGSLSGGTSGSATGHSAGASGAAAGGAAAAGASGAHATGGQGGTAATAGGGSGGGGTSGGGSGGASALPLVELARGKAVSASSEQAGNEAPRGNDASLTTRWCALHGTFPQWWRVDLGANHALHDFSVKFEHGDRKYSYKVETSNDDAVYTLQSTINGTGDEQSDSFASGVSGRFVRITVTSAEPFVDTTSHPTWASFWDFRVNGW